ncbi:MAG TPA: RagB/SusD family nutrient uptake outer membrane protein [Longimicrobium sp.]|nr:RagB/SusD family nutrient uptake outer membrane protein [Longimicrobium sp.]
MKILKNLLPILAGAAFMAACDNPLEVNPTASIPFDESLDSREEIASGVNGMYDALQVDGAYARNLLVFPDLYTDNLRFSGTFSTDREVSSRAVRPTNGAITGIWGAAYNGINRANNVLAAVDSVYEATDLEATQFKGEALFIRALNYHNLVRFFGGVPVVTAPTWEISPEVNVPRSTPAQVYSRIAADLQQSITMLNQVRAAGITLRAGRANVWAARALLARVSLDMGQWAQARDLASQVISNTGSDRFSLVDDYRNIWRVENNSESIFEVQFTISDANSLAFWFFPSELGGRYGFNPAAVSFLGPNSPTNERRNGSVGISEGAFYVNKFFRIETGDDNVPVIRLAEMYLIRAEANWRLGADPATVRADINVVRARSELAPLDATVATSTQLRDAILAERRAEFAFEGHRLFDLRRILGDAETATRLQIEQFRLVFPVPQRELDANPALTQTPGY